MYSLELCAGAGGQAIGLEKSGFEHMQLVEIDSNACATLRLNRPNWNIFEGDLHSYSALHYKGIDLVAGGVPCPPFSKAGKQLGGEDERDLFPQALRIIDECRPPLIMLENVKGFLDPKFYEYRENLKTTLNSLGYTVDWKLLNASDFGVSQLRPRVVIIAIRKTFSECFNWQMPQTTLPPTVGNLLGDLMAENGWVGVENWIRKASTIAPTLVGGSKKHGGPDLGPTRAKQAWALLGVDGSGIADAAPLPNFIGNPKLTVRMAARIQGFPDQWQFSGKKTPAYRQVGNAFPPPVAQAVGLMLQNALNLAAKRKLRIA